MAPASLEASAMRSAPENALQVPSSSTFSFKAPFPASSSSTSFAVPSPLKQRRVSLALPSSPRVAHGWNFRDDTGLESHVPETAGSGLVPERRGKMRKLTNGADGEPYQEKKQRKKWSDEETKMLVLGCNRHGVGNWKTILSDPTLQFDNRSPVDLKDRFRTYFPDAYKEHYPNARTHLSSKVRSTLPDGSSLFEKTRSKKRRPFTEEEDRALKAGYEKHGTVWATIVKDPIFREQGRRSTDLRDRFRNAFPELYQAAGYKPRNASKKKQVVDETLLPVRAATDDQLALSTTGPVRTRRRAHTSQGLLRGGTKSVPQSTACSEDDDSSAGEEEGDSIFKAPQTPVFVDNVSTSSLRSKKRLPFHNDSSFSTTDDDEMDMVTFEQLSDPLNIPDFMPSSQSTHSHYPTEMDGQSQTWSSGINTPTHSNHAWSTAAGSPTSSHLSADYLMSASHSPSLHRRGDHLGGMGMIGKSAWGTQDWFSANPRLDPENSGPTGFDGPLSPASPFALHHLSHGVMDRYDLLPSLLPHDFSSEVGVGDTHSTFSDEIFPPSSGFRGFTHHSNTAGDLIFGTRAHPGQSGYSYGSSGFGGAYGTPGLGLSGISAQSTGIHPMQLALPGIDEIELTGITLNDSSANEDAGMTDDMNTHTSKKDEARVAEEAMSPSDRFSLDDLVDLSAHDLELHATPPGTPLLSRPRQTRRLSESASQTFHSPHGRSISVPPTEARAQPPLPSASLSAASLAQATSPMHSPMARPNLPVTSRHGQQRYFGGQERSSPIQSPHPGPSTPLGVKGVSAASSPISSPPPVSPTPPSAAVYPQQMLFPSLSHDPYSWRPMAFTETNNLNLSFLDLHYYSQGGAGGGVGGSGLAGQMAWPGWGGDEVQDTNRQGQALDLASSSASLRSLGIPATLRQHIPQGGGGIANGNGNGNGNMFGAGKMGVMGGPLSTGRSQSHHRGQSAVCPQDLVLRNDNKRKRASWDGAHS